MFAENSKRSYKCSKCGMMFPIDKNHNSCPTCGYKCTKENCTVVDSSDEDY